MALAIARRVWGHTLWVLSPLPPTRREGLTRGPHGCLVCALVVWREFFHSGGKEFLGMAGLFPARSSPSAGRARTTVLITGFGPFPGVPVNATMRLVPELVRTGAHLHPDVRILSEILATEWAAAPQRLEPLLAEARPDLVLHFGVSSRARGFEIEARARNACTQSPDAAGALPAGAAVQEGGAEHLATSLPVQHIVTRLRLRGIPAFVSRDAGGYLCNATLYHSLG